jgi:hypothetical protein
VLGRLRLSGAALTRHNHAHILALIQQQQTTGTIAKTRA